ncbi:MAG: type I restriction-modification system subunit M [Candidatus Thermoplasmatota archaeon]|nr:type I restriction-modification system subunit M [Candidatus Thermoplasmatota archaeon]MCL5889026.1 type I restriction-modification system subunit M [Candidatus Thermoplasmatota archaeon]
MTQHDQLSDNVKDWKPEIEPVKNEGNSDEDCKKEYQGKELEKKLWTAADKLRSNMDAAEYKHVVLGLIFLKYISDTFQEVYQELKDDRENFSDPEDRDEYKMRNVFWVPPDARWDYLQRNAKQPTIGRMIDDAMDVIERDNPSLKGVLPTNYSRPQIDKQRLGELIDLIGSIAIGTLDARESDVLGRVYEYFLGQFFLAEGRKGGQFYTPRSIVRLLVEMIEPFSGRVLDPCCGSGGMFVQSERFILAHQGKMDDIHIFGQESNQTTWKLCKMNLAIRNIDSDEVKWNNEGSFLNDLHKDVRADYILANPPFNDSDWRGELVKGDVRWKFGVPPTGNANFAWIQHFIHHLKPTGIAGFVLANGSMSSNTSNEGEIRKNIIEADFVDCMVALPTQLFMNTQIPACLWFVAKDKKNNKFKDRRGKTLFIDARSLGTMINRKSKVLCIEDIKKISDTYHSWRGESGYDDYQDVAGFCNTAEIDKIRKNNYILTPGRYVGTEENEDDDGEFQKKMVKLTTELKQQMEESKRLDEEIRKNLEKIGWRI